MIFEVLGGLQAAPDRSRPGGSIGDVKFEIWRDQTSQNRPQSVDFLHLPGGKPEKSQSIGNPLGLDRFDRLESVDGDTMGANVGFLVGSPDPLSLFSYIFSGFPPGRSTLWGRFWLVWSLRISNLTSPIDPAGRDLSGAAKKSCKTFKISNFRWFFVFFFRIFGWKVYKSLL